MKPVVHKQTGCIEASTTSVRLRISRSSVWNN